MTCFKKAEERWLFRFFDLIRSYNEVLIGRGRNRKRIV